MTANNILICRRGRLLDDISPFAVVTRYKYSVVDEFRVDWLEVWDPEALNRIGNPGAFRDVADADAIERMIANIRHEHGPLPVQCNLRPHELSRPLTIETHEDSASAARGTA